jgi:hypothetical protein
MKNGRAVVTMAVVLGLWVLELGQVGRLRDQATPKSLSHQVGS